MSLNNKSTETIHMKTKYKILIVALVILIVGILLTLHSFLANPYKSEMKYKNESFKSVQFEIPDFWKEYAEESPYQYQPKTNMAFEDGKNYVSMIISVEDSDWNQTVLEETCTRFLNRSVSLMMSYISFSNVFDQNEPCKIQCKQEIYDKFKIKDFSESSEIKEKFDTCVKKCREESRKYDIENYGSATKINKVAKQTSLKDGSLFIGEAIGLNCDTDKIVYILFAIDSNKISKDKLEGIISHISNSIKCE